jgi:hypothetical protein
VPEALKKGGGGGDEVKKKRTSKKKGWLIRWDYDGLISRHTIQPRRSHRSSSSWPRPR